MLTKIIYKWHRRISLIVAIPVLLWALSGFMHPLMTNIRPRVTTQILTPVPIDSSKIQTSLEDALRLNHIDSIYAFRMVHIADNWFYQVQVSREKEPLYLATLNGKLLSSGNWLYAQWLARQFLEGDGTEASTATQASTESGHDCCDAATACVLGVTKGAAVKDVSFVNTYNDEYKSINRLLPVYRVSFARNDGIRIYVEPATDRFAFAMDNKRRLLDRIFTTVHTWGWIGFLGKGKFIFEFILAALAFVNALAGIYIFLNTRSKKMPGSVRSRARRNHRYTAIVIALFTLMFSFSGAWHALSKMEEDDRASYFVDCRFAATDLHFDFRSIAARFDRPVVNAGIIHLNNEYYWRVQFAAKPTGKTAGDLMKPPAPNTSVVYVSQRNDSILINGDEQYARYLAGVFSANEENEISSALPVTRFGAEYNFTDKRLPVWRIQYALPGDERFFIETATGSVTKHVTDADLREGYSFAFFHKHEFLGWAGKGWKDFSTMFWALAQVVLVVFGLILYFRMRNNKPAG